MVAPFLMRTVVKKQYFADQRDYTKYSILRYLLEQKISRTVCWMMTPNDGTTQGAHKGYLRRPGKWEDFDPVVFSYLKKQVDSGSPDVRSIEHASPIECCRFYWKCFPLEIWPESGGSRASGYTWSQQA